MAKVREGIELPIIPEDLITSETENNPAVLVLRPCLNSQNRDCLYQTDFEGRPCTEDPDANAISSKVP